MGKSCQYIDEDLAKAKKSDSDISVVDPFEQRGAKTIILEKSQKQKPMASVSATTSGKLKPVYGTHRMQSMRWTAFMLSTSTSVFKSLYFNYSSSASVFKD